MRTRLTLVAAGLCLAVVGPGYTQPVLEFTASSFSVNEASGALTLPVKRQGATSLASTVDYATTNGTATAELNYTAVSGTLLFGVGETNGYIQVPILNNGFVDGTKTFRVVLSNPTGGAVLGTHTTATVSIADNDYGIQFQFATYSVAEDAGAVRIGVVRDDDGEVAVTVDYSTSDLSATSGLDYTGVTNALAFAPTDRLKFFDVPILNNSAKQLNRLFRLTLSNPTGGSLGSTKTATVTIKDNDQGFQFETNSYSVAEDAGAVLIHVLRGTDDTNSPATVDIATIDATAMNGLDYTGTTNTLAFAPGDQVKVVALPMLNDGIKEGTETFRVTLSNPTGGAELGAPTTTVSILDNDPGLGFALSSGSVWAGAGALTLAVVRGNDDALVPITVDYATADGTAQAGRDYQAISGTLSFQENETVKSLTIPILPGAAAGGSGTLSVTLSNPTGGAVLGTAATTVTIRKNYCTVAPPFDSQLAIRREGGVNVLTWSGGGKLQRADRVTGPWQTLTVTQRPYPVQPPTPATFYLVAPPRPVNLYVPSSYDRHTPMPLVILLHGSGSTGADAEAYMQFRPLAESRGFLYCYPDGFLNWFSGGKTWNPWDEERDPVVESGGDYVDDVAYLRSLIEEVGRQFALDPKRVYLIGHSGGGCTVYTTALRSADVISGIAVLAGYLAFDFNQYAPSEPVNILHINGTADHACLYWGGAVTIAWGLWVNLTPFPSMPRIMQIWAGYNGASGPQTDPSPTLDLTTDVAGLDTVVTRYTNARPGGAVELWTINGGAHSPSLSSQFSPQVIDWLLAHPKP